MFQFPAFASRISRDNGLAPAELPHSDIRGSMGICPSPRLFAACHVLRRLREPRHPPYALLLPLYRFRYQVFYGFDCSCFFLLVALLFAICVLIHTPSWHHPSGSAIRSRGQAPPVCQCTLSLVENNGVEPLTLCLQSRCSSQLS